MVIIACMNYQKIYDKFVVDRRAKESGLKLSGEYKELHHIIPRSLGGSDEANNLIWLTPEDHYFAHLLLAHIHHGRMWVVVKAMCNGWSRVKTDWRRQRPMYGVARRKVAEFGRAEMSAKFANGELDYFVKPGQLNNKFNHQVFDWVNLDSGEKKSATLYLMHKEFGCSRGIWTSVVSGARKSANGWALQGTQIRIRGLKGKSFHFVNRSGEEFFGTQSEFCKHTRLSAATGTRVCRDQSVTACGWRLKETSDRPHTAQKRDGKPARLNSGADYSITKDGVTHTGKVLELCKVLNCTKPQFHASIYLLKHGKIKTYKGWRLCVE